MYRQADGMIIVFEKTKRETFAGVRQWIQSIYKNAKPSLPVSLVGNKEDFTKETVITEEEGKALAESFKMEYHEICAPMNGGIDQMFADIMEQAYKNKFIDKTPTDFVTDLKNAPIKLNPSFHIAEPPLKKQKKRAC